MVRALNGGRQNAVTALETRTEAIKYSYRPWCLKRRPSNLIAGSCVSNDGRQTNLSALVLLKFLSIYIEYLSFYGFFHYKLLFTTFISLIKNQISVFYLYIE